MFVQEIRLCSCGSILTVFCGDLTCQSHTLVEVPALLRETGLNSPIYLTACLSNLLYLCVGLFGAGC